MIPGEYILVKGDIQINAGRPVTKITVVNTGDRPIQVGSHFHFFEVNKQMEFDRVKAYGQRLNIAAGTAVRFEPGEEKDVELVPFGGSQKLYGFNDLANNNVSETPDHADLYQKLEANNFKNKTS